MNENVSSIQRARELQVESILTSNRSWGKKYANLVKQLEANDASTVRMAQNTLCVMENQSQFLARMGKDKRMEAVFTQVLGPLVPKILDIVRIFYPNLITHKLVDVQPMDRQNGQIVLVRPVYTHSGGGVTAGQQVFKHQTDGTYASETATTAIGTGDGADTTFNGTVGPLPVRPGTAAVTAGNVKAVDNGVGGLSGTGVTGTINYATGAVALTFTVAPANGVVIAASHRYDSEQNTAPIRSLDIQITNLPIQAEPHPLRVTWSQHSQMAAEAHLDLDIGDLMSNLVASFIKQERDMKVVSQIVLTAKAETLLNFDATPPSNYSKLARYAEIGVKLDYAESLIQTDLGRGGVSWILCGNNAANVWSQVAGFEPSGVQAPIGPYEIGTLRDGTVSVIKVPTMNPNEYVVGFKGYVVGDSSIVLGEWIPLYATPVWNAPDLINHQGMMSLYASVVNEPGYFRKGTISGFAA